MSDESYSVEIPNGDTQYSVFWGLDHLKNNAVYAGVNVSVKDKLVATVNCASHGKIVNNLQGVNLQPTP